MMDVKLSLLFRLLGLVFVLVPCSMDRKQSNRAGPSAWQSEDIMS